METRIIFYLGTLSCDKGYVFTHNVSSTYVCYYSTAEFMPKNIPRCISGKSFALFCFIQLIYH